MMNLKLIFVEFGYWLINLLDCGFTRQYIFNNNLMNSLFTLVWNTDNTSQSDKTSGASNSGCCDGKQELEYNAEKTTEEMDPSNDDYQKKTEDMERETLLLRQQNKDKEKKIEDFQKENLLSKQQRRDKDSKISDMEQEMEILRTNLERLKSRAKENDTEDMSSHNAADGSEDAPSKKPKKKKNRFLWLKDSLSKQDGGNPSKKKPCKIKKVFKQLKDRMAKLAPRRAGAPSEKPRKRMKGFKKLKNSLANLGGKQKAAASSVKRDCFQLLRDGKAELAKGNSAEAIKLLSEAIEMGQFDFIPLGDALFHRGVAKFFLKQWEEAMEDCTESIKQVRLHARCFLVRGCCWILLGKYNEAFKDFEEYVTSNVHHPKEYYCLAKKIECEAKTIRKIEDAMITLGVFENATMEQIRKSYRALCLKYHPDKNRWDDTQTILKKQETCKKIITAYKFLTSEGNFEKNLEKLQKLKEMKLELVKIVEKLLY
ncbi:uncharacterized protein LOC135211446 [Macrobrachium nipponense]|uniref:uncharacterized protein LOC135211446 n=1 Tax=Macrobrachium nipponense TaxID=159736 RepID=UPI0030C8BE27